MPSQELVASPPNHSLQDDQVSIVPASHRRDAAERTKAPPPVTNVPEDGMGYYALQEIYGCAASRMRQLEKRGHRVMARQYAHIAMRLAEWGKIEPHYDVISLASFTSPRAGDHPVRTPAR